MNKSWSDYLIQTLAGLTVLAIGGAVAYFWSDTLIRAVALLILVTITIVAILLIPTLRHWLFRVLKWLAGKWRLVLLLAVLAILNLALFQINSDWKILTISLVQLVVVFVGFRVLSTPIAETKRKKVLQSKPNFLPISLPPGVANSYLKNRYLDPPSGDITLNGVQFQIQPDSLILDTNEVIRLTFPRDDGCTEFGFQLPKPVKNVKTVYFLINSGNSKSVYNSFKVGEIILIFKDAPPINTKLILGQNIREWCVGNPGDLVREVSDHTFNHVAWRGMNKQGTSAVIDCLKIPVFECMRGNALEQISFAHNPAKRPPDTMGIHFSVFAVSLELEPT